ncbi:MAG: methyltransferase domain-containing protein, partial [Myxococcota bacterium]
MSIQTYFSCPRCEGALVEDGGVLRCSSCGLVIPERAGLTHLLADPPRFAARWGASRRQFGIKAEHNRNAIAAQLDGPMLSVQRRLSRLQTGLDENAATLADLMDEAGFPAGEGEPFGNVMDGYVQALRDWAWTTEENEVALDAVAPVRGRVLVIGAGASRLAYDLAVRDRPEAMVLVDVHPVPFLLAQRALVGPALKLWEFPANPSKEMCVSYALEPRGDAPGDWSYVLADGLTLPVRPGAFDTVLTPWFIDQVPRDLQDFLPTVHRALKPGGRWLNLGPLVYPGNIPLRCRYTIDEIVELTQRAGFSLTGPPSKSRQHYLCSPASAQGRLEDVYAWEAERQPGPPATRKPGWQLSRDHPVPRWPGLSSYVPPNPVFVKVVERIDGVRSARAIAQSLIQDLGIPAARAVEGVEITLRKI